MIVAKPSKKLMFMIILIIAIILIIVIILPCNYFDDYFDEWNKYCDHFYDYDGELDDCYNLRIYNFKNNSV